AADHRADGDWHRRHDQHVDRIAVAGDRARDVAVVARVVHGGHHEPVHEHRAGFLVDLVLDWLRVHRDLDDHVELVGSMATGADSIQIHAIIIDVASLRPTGRRYPGTQGRNPWITPLASIITSSTTARSPLRDRARSRSSIRPPDVAWARSHAAMRRTSIAQWRRHAPRSSGRGAAPPR